MSLVNMGKSNMYCCVPGCSSWSKKCPDVSFHQFPVFGKKVVSMKNKIGKNNLIDQHTAWKIKLRIGKKATKYMYVCSRHFEEADYFPRRDQEQNKILKRNVIPSRNLPSSVTSLPKASTSRDQRQKDREGKKSCQDMPLTLEPNEKCECGDGVQPEPSQEELQAAETLLSLLICQPGYKGPANIKALQRDFSVQVNTPMKITISSIIETDQALNSFTGLNNFKMLIAIVELVRKNFPDKKLHLLALKDRIILTFTKLKTNLTFIVLSILFNISQQLCKKYIYETIPKIAAVLKPVIVFSPMQRILQNMPKCFEDFQNCRVVVDCTEISVQKPKCLCCRIKFYSHYKSTETVKFMVGVSPGGLISYVSKPYGGRASDKTIFEDGDIILKLDRNDAVMVDKGFLIDDLCVSHSIELIRPPFLRQKQQLTAEDAQLNAKIAGARVHIERVNQRIKLFKILSGKLQWSLVPQVYNIFLIACGISNLSAPILSDERFLK